MNCVRNIFSASILSVCLSVYIVVDVSKQRLYLMDSETVKKEYAVSTSKHGTGSKKDSCKTPLGRHRIAKKIGTGGRLNEIYKDRKAAGKIALINNSKEPSKEDFVTTRILWLEGLEKGRNKGGSVDSFKRYIYIHGTPDEGLIGRPASHGCVRMKNTEVAELFDLVEEGTEVVIRK